MKRTGVLLIIIFSNLYLYPQKYITAGGVRFSNEGFGLTLQQHIFEHTTVEGIAMANFNEVSVAGLIEKHNNLLFSKSLNTYAGIGPVFGKYYASDSGYIGCDVIFGLEYKVLLLPIVISADIKPRFKLEQDYWFRFGAGISFRYVFIKEKKTLFNRKGN